MKKVLRIIFGLSAVLVCMLVSCKKYSHTTDDLKGNNYIAGIAYMYDDYSTNGTLTPMTNLKVAIQYTGSPLGSYIYSTRTDSSGIYIFENLQNNVPYTVYALDTMSGITFYGQKYDTLHDDKQPITDDTLIVAVDSLHQNGFIYTVTDSAGNIISGCLVCVFSAPYLYAQNDSGCLGAIYKLTTNTFGKVSQFGVNPETYLTRAGVMFGMVTLAGQAPPLVIKSVGVIRDTIIVGR